MRHFCHAVATGHKLYQEAEVLCNFKTPPIDMVATLSNITYPIGSHNDTLKLRTQTDNMRGYNIPGVSFHTSKDILNTAYGHS